jgi:hypothetical protein
MRLFGVMLADFLSVLSTTCHAAQLLADRISSAYPHNEGVLRKKFHISPCFRCYAEKILNSTILTPLPRNFATTISHLSGDRH